MVQMLNMNEQKILAGKWKTIKTKMKNISEVKYSFDSHNSKWDIVGKPQAR